MSDLYIIPKIGDTELLRATKKLIENLNVLSGSFSNASMRAMEFLTTLDNSSGTTVLQKNLLGLSSVLRTISNSVTSTEVAYLRNIKVSDKLGLSYEQLKQKFQNVSRELKAVESQLLKAMSEEERDDAVVRNLSKNYASLANELAVVGAAYEMRTKSLLSFSAGALQASDKIRVLSDKLREVAASEQKLSFHTFITSIRLLSEALKTGGISAEKYSEKLKELVASTDLSRNFNVISSAVKVLSQDFKSGLIGTTEYKESLKELVAQFRVSSVKSVAGLTDAIKLLTTAQDSGVRVTAKYAQVLNRLVKIKLKDGNFVGAIKDIAQAFEGGRITATQYQRAIDNVNKALTKNPAQAGKYYKELTAIMKRLKTEAISAGGSINQIGFHRVISDLRRLDRETKRVTVSFGRFTEKIYMLAQFYVIRRFLFTLSAIGREAISTSLKMDQSFKNSGAIMKLTAYQIDEVKNKVYELGLLTGESFEKIARSYEDIARSGVTFSASLKLLSSSVILAKATNASMEQSVSSLLVAMKAFSDELQGDTVRAMDIITAAVNNTRLSLDSFNQGFKYVASIAGAARVPLKDVAMMLGVLSDSGLSASKSGVYLRSTIAELLRITPKFEKNLESIGLTEADVSLRNNDLIDSLRKMSEHISKASSSIFAFNGMSKRSAQGLQVLLSSMDKLQKLMSMDIKSEAMINLQYQLQSIKTVMDIVANQFKSSLIKAFESSSGAVLALTNSFSGFVEILGNMSSYIGPVLTFVTTFSLLNKVVGAKLWTNLVRSTKELKTFITTLLATRTAAQATSAAVGGAGMAGSLASLSASLPLLISAVAAGAVAWSLFGSDGKESIDEITRSIESLRAKLDNLERASKLVQRGLSDQSLSTLDVANINKALDVNLGALIAKYGNYKKALEESNRILETRVSILKQQLAIEEEDKLKKQIESVKELSQEYDHLMARVKTLTSIETEPVAADTDLFSGFQAMFSDVTELSERARKTLFDLFNDVTELLYNPQVFDEDPELVKALQKIFDGLDSVTLGEKAQKVFTVLTDETLSAEQRIRSLADAMGVESAKTKEFIQVKKDLTVKLKDVSMSTEALTLAQLKLVVGQEKGSEASKKLVKVINELRDGYGALSQSTVDVYKNTQQMFSEVSKMQTQEVTPTVDTAFFNKLANINDSIYGSARARNVELERSITLESAFVANLLESVAATATVQDHLDDISKSFNVTLLKQKIGASLLKVQKGLLDQIRQSQQRITSLSKEEVKATEDTVAVQIKLAKLREAGGGRSFDLRDELNITEEIINKLKEAEQSALAVGNFKDAVEFAKRIYTISEKTYEKTKDNSDYERRSRLELIDHYEDYLRIQELATENIKKEKATELEVLNTAKQRYSEFQKVMEMFQDSPDTWTVEWVNGMLDGVNRVVELFNSRLVATAEDFSGVFISSMEEAAQYMKDHPIIGDLVSKDSIDSLRSEISKVAIVSDTGWYDELKTKLVEMAKEASAQTGAAFDESYQKVVQEFGVKLKDAGISSLRDLQNFINDEYDLNVVLDGSFDEGQLQQSLNTIQGLTIDVQANVSGVTGVGVPGFASGGRIPGYGGGDIIPALLEPGEFVVRKEAVDFYGAGLLDKINKMALSLKSIPRFQSGGFVAPDMGTVNLVIGGNSYPVSGKIDVLASLKNEIRQINRRRG